MSESCKILKSATRFADISDVFFVVVGFEIQPSVPLCDSHLEILFLKLFMSQFKFSSNI